MTQFAWELTFVDSTRIVIVQATQTDAETKAKQLYPNLALRATTRLGVFRETDPVDHATPAPIVPVQKVKQ